MTVDEELSQLEDSIRKLKIEFDVYFNGGSPRPPTDAQWRVDNILKRLGDGGRLTFGQRFRLNSLTQRYAIFNDLWRQKVKNREEGREPRQREEIAARRPPGFAVQWHDPEREPEKVQQLFDALVEAKKKLGETAEALPMESFRRFVKQKTEQLKKDFGCQTVEYVVEVESGQVRLKARGGS